MKEKNNTNKFVLPDLPYPLSELEPYIGRDTLYYHHGFHHKGYVNNLNEALAKDSTFHKKYTQIEEIILNYQKANKTLQLAIKNNGGGHLNHSMFWKLMCSHRKKEANINNFELIRDKIINEFGSFEAFTTIFQQQAIKLFGSGWVWLVIHVKTNKMSVVSTPGHNNPISDGFTPLLVIDVWEHAYYLDYKNNRSKFVEIFFKIINWSYVESLYKNTQK